MLLQTNTGMFQRSQYLVSTALSEVVDGADEEVAGNS